MKTLNSLRVKLDVKCPECGNDHLTDTCDGFVCCDECSFFDTKEEIVRIIIKKVEACKKASEKCRSAAMWMLWTRNANTLLRSASKVYQ